jgi:hypothetical protein
VKKVKKIENRGKKKKGELICGGGKELQTPHHPPPHPTLKIDRSAVPNSLYMRKYLCNWFSFVFKNLDTNEGGEGEVGG